MSKVVMDPGPEPRFKGVQNRVSNHQCPNEDQAMTGPIP